MSKLVYVGFAFMHHKNTNAGYHHIADYLKYDKKIDCQKEYDHSQTLPNFILRILIFLHYPFNMWVAIRCIIYNFFHSDCIFHFIYGENTYRWLKFFLKKSNRIVCTFHQPYSFFENKTWQRRLRELNGIILMSNDEINKFKSAAQQAYIKFIPHGVNVNFYIDTKTTKKNQILMVGNWLRNFNFANRVFQKLLSETELERIVVVTNSMNYTYFSPHPKLVLLSNISDEQLRDLYNESRCLFLPLIEYTANNAILEAAVTNCPIIISTDNPSSSYIDNSLIKITPMTEQDAIEAIKDSPTAKDTRKTVVDKFSWQTISDMTRQYFNNI